jgi:hypothetical protein
MSSYGFGGHGLGSGRAGADAARTPISINLTPSSRVKYEGSRFHPGVIYVLKSMDEIDGLSEVRLSQTEPVHYRISKMKRGVKTFLSQPAPHMNLQGTM